MGQLARRINMHYQPIGPMTAENVEEFDVRICDSRDLVVSVVPIHAPWSASVESYQLTQPA